MLQQLKRYMRDPSFLKEYQDATLEIIESAALQAKQGLGVSLQCLREIVENKNEATSNRIAAARLTLEYALKLSERSDVTNRIAALESLLTEIEKDESEKLGTAH